MAALAGASKSSQIGWEAGRTAPNAEYLAVAMAQGIDVIYVLTGVRSGSEMLDLQVAAGRATMQANLSSQERAESAERLVAAMRSHTDATQERALLDAWGVCSADDRRAVLRIITALAETGKSGKNR